MRRLNNQSNVSYNASPEDHVTITITNKINRMSSWTPEACIFRVHDQLRKVKASAYEPEVLTVGPYHYGKGKLYVEDQKVRYLQQLLRRRGEESIDRYVRALRSLEVEARGHYADEVTVDTNVFLEMMLLDGLFIVELFRKHKTEALREAKDPLHNMDWLHHCIKRDLLLLENQLPFVVLNKLYGMTKEQDREPSDLSHIALEYLVGSSVPPNIPELGNCKHLLDLRHRIMVPTNPTKDVRNADWSTIHSAVELRESGVKFTAAELKNQFLSFTAIKFVNGVLEIPTLVIDDHTETNFRNLVAYEQHSQARNKANYITDYIAFMDFLIGSREDVEVLRRKKIIEHTLGDDEVVSNMFKNLGNHITLRNFYYSKVLKDLNEHCDKKWNHRKAKLRREYFNSPWSLLSFLGALLLLIFTLMQTVFTVLQYIEKD